MDLKPGYGGRGDYIGGFQVMAEAAHDAMGRTAHGVDLDAMTVEELTALRDEVEGKRQAKLDAERDAILSDTRARLAKLGLTLESAIPAKGGDVRRRHAGGKVAVKYRGPKGEEWSGRGRLPQWVTDVEAKGKSREDFAVHRKE